MRNTVTIGRWRIDLYKSAIYLQKQPNPDCVECRGHGAIEGAAADHARLVEAVIEPCSCWDPFRSVRIPLGRTVITERFPF